MCASATSANVRVSRRHEKPVDVASRYVGIEDPVWIEEKFISDSKGQLFLKLLLSLTLPKRMMFKSQLKSCSLIV